MVDGFYELLGEAIRKRRNAIGMTQEALADRTGLVRTSITNIERGRQTVLVHQLVGIAKALGMPPAALIPAGGMQNADNDATTIPDEVELLLSRLEAKGHRKASR